MEIWKDINGYEGCYQVSNFGNVRSLERQLADKNGKLKTYKERLLMLQPNSRGYFRVNLKKQGIDHKVFVHRLVAMHFVDNPDGITNNIVNHIDNDYTNNSADNLEWTTLKGNSQHAKKQGRLKRDNHWRARQRAKHEANGRSVVGTNIKTGEMVRFVCLNDSRKAGFEPSCVCECCKNERRTHAGYTWRYA
jgi:hypothetical protein